MKTKNKIIISIVSIILILFLIIIYENQPSQKLKRFCKPNEKYKNYFNTSEREFLALSIANKVHEEMNFFPSSNDIQIDNIINNIILERSGDCRHFSLILKECLNLYDFDNEIVYVEYDYLNITADYHMFNIVKFSNSKNRKLDSTLSDREMSLIFLDRTNFNFWDYSRDNPNKKLQGGRVLK